MATCQEAPTAALFVFEWTGRFTTDDKCLFV
jgi:hypothetical protein